MNFLLFLPCVRLFYSVHLKYRIGYNLIYMVI